ncbi:MAG: O-antigen ligase family protein [Coriobacteriia bacterium]
MLGISVASVGSGILPLVGVLAALLLALTLTPSQVLVALAFLVPFRIVDAYSGLVLPGQAVLSDAVLAAFALSALVHPRKEGGRSLPTLALLLGAVLVLWALASTVQSGYLMEGLRKTGRMVVVLMAVLGAWQSLSREEAHEASRILAMSSGIAALLGIGITLFGVGKYGGAGPGGLPRLWAGLVDPNHYGVFLAMVAILVVFGTPARKRTGSWLGLVGLLFVAEALTLSRGAVIGLLFGLLVALLLSRVAQTKGRDLGTTPRLTMIGLGLVLVMLLGVVVAPGFVGIAVDRYAGLADPLTDPTGALRLRIWNAGLEMLSESPLFGIGPGAFSARIANSGLFSQGWEAHNSILESVVENGYVGASALGGLILWVLVAGVGGVRRLISSHQATDDDAGLTIAAFGAVVAGIGGALFVSNLLYQAPFVLFLLIMVGGFTPRSNDGVLTP